MPGADEALLRRKEAGDPCRVFDEVCPPRHTAHARA